MCGEFWSMFATKELAEQKEGKFTIILFDVKQISLLKIA